MADIKGSVRGSGDPVFTLYIGTIVEAKRLARNITARLAAAEVDNGFTAWDAIGSFQGITEPTVVMTVEAPRHVLEFVLNLVAEYALDARYVHVDIKAGVANNWAHGSRPAIETIDLPGSVYVDLDVYRAEWADKLPGWVETGTVV